MAKRQAATDSVMQPAAKKRKQPGAKPLAALPPSKDDKRVTSTVVGSEGGAVILATTHSACKGRGCDDCNGLGFTKGIQAQTSLLA
jgi:hypothetical protein